MIRPLAAVIAASLALACAQTPNPSFADVSDTPNLPRVLLIGDSISMGYTIPVRELLRGKANVHRIPANGGPTTRGLEDLDAWLGPGQWDVIHFNFGLHDLKLMEDGTHQVSIADYRRNLRKIIERLRKTGAVLIWATTTPVPEGRLNPPRRSSDVPVYNTAAQKVIEGNGIAIDDLYAIAEPHLIAWQRPANVHYTEEGYQGLAQAVANSIERALAKTSATAH